MREFIERNVAAIIIALVFVLAFSSCTATRHAPGITEWNKQYSCR